MNWEEKKTSLHVVMYDKRTELLSTNTAHKHQDPPWWLVFFHAQQWRVCEMVVLCLWAKTEVPSISWDHLWAPLPRPTHPRMLININLIFINVFYFSYWNITILGVDQRAYTQINVCVVRPNNIASTTYWIYFVVSSCLVLSILNLWMNQIIAWWFWNIRKNK